MKVTVILITYNHEKFIEEALKSILMQEVAFEYEIVVLEDCSTDRTPQILKEYQDKYPNKIRLQLAESNQNSNKDFGNAILASQSEYIALLDGDDFWTSPHKLQRQVEYLDCHNECSICFHQAYNLFPDGRRVLYSENFGYEFNKASYTLEDIMFGNFVPTCSIVFRTGLFREFPQSFDQMPSGDWFLNLLNAQHGKIGYIDETWGVRRAHPGGIISMKSPKEKLIFNIVCLDIINSYLNYKYAKEANEKLLYYSYEVVKLAAEEQDFKNARTYAARCLKLSPFDRRISKLFLTVLLLPEVFSKKLYRLLLQLRSFHEEIHRPWAAPLDPQ